MQLAQQSDSFWGMLTTAGGQGEGGIDKQNAHGSLPCIQTVLAHAARSLQTLKKTPQSNRASGEYTVLYNLTQNFALQSRHCSLDSLLFLTVLAAACSCQLLGCVDYSGCFDKSSGCTLFDKRRDVACMWILCRCMVSVQVCYIRYIPDMSHT